MAKAVCIAYCVEADREYRVELTPYCVKKDWPDEVIWAVAKREMLNQHKRSVTCWCWQYGIGEIAPRGKGGREA
jgi:hypothetical protein